MNARNIIILAVTLAVLAGGLWYRKASRQTENVVTAESLHSFVTPEAAASADTVEMTRPDNSIVRLEKKDGKWLLPALGGVPANARTVEQMLRALSEMRGEHRSSDPAVLGDYELREDQALRLTMQAGGKMVADILFGKGDFRSVFARSAGSSDVQVVPGTILGQIGAYGPSLSPRNWMETTILTVNPDQIRRIALRTPSGAASLTRLAPPDGDAANATVVPRWDFRQDTGKGPDETLLKGIIPALQRVTVTEPVFPEESAPAVPTHSLEIETPTERHTLEGSHKTEGVFLVRLQGSPHLYRVDETVFLRLFPETPAPSK